jgi:hypothetical protein
MSDYISKNDAMQAIFNVDCHSDEHIAIREEAMAAIDCMPAADVAPVVPARWDEDGCCSKCGSDPAMLLNAYQSGLDLSEANYCPNCGARMGCPLVEREEQAND